MTDYTDLIARLREATEGTTPGPWTIRRDAYGVLLMHAGDDAIMGNRIHEEWTPPETDWPFIAAARQLVPETAAAIEALQAENERLREALRGLLVQFPPINWTPVAGEAQATVSVASLAVASAALTGSPR